MKAALILALTISQTIPALSQTANQAALTEARHFFISCPKSPLDKAAGCHLNHAQFLEHYVLAKSGDADAMSQIAYLLDYDASPDFPPLPGIRQDPRQACAWIVAEANSTTENSQRIAARARYARKCAGFSPNETRAVMERAEVLLRELRYDPTTPPKEPPYTPSNDRNLITTVPDRCPAAPLPKTEGCVDY